MGAENASVFTPIVAIIIASQGGIVVILIAALVPMAWRVGKIPTHQDFGQAQTQIKHDIAQARDEVRTELKQDIAHAADENKLEIREVKTELRQELAESRTGLKQDVAELRTEMRENNVLLLQEIRRSHQQIMLALANHSHNADGQTVFTLAPGTELVPSPADN